MDIFLTPQGFVFSILMITFTHFNTMSMVLPEVSYSFESFRMWWCLTTFTYNEHPEIDPYPSSVDLSNQLKWKDRNPDQIGEPILWLSQSYIIFMNLSLFSLSSSCIKVGYVNLQCRQFNYLMNKCVYFNNI